MGVRTRILVHQRDLELTNVRVATSDAVVQCVDPAAGQGSLATTSDPLSMVMMNALL